MRTRTPRWGPVRARLDHGLGEIVTALIAAGLPDREPPGVSVRELEARLPRGGRDGTWRLPGELDGRLPLFFSIRASKPAPGER
jgi:hypothetical protein